MLSSNTNHTTVAKSLAFRNEYIDIYVASWGPTDDGKQFGRPNPASYAALENATNHVIIISLKACNLIM